MNYLQYRAYFPEEVSPVVKAAVIASFKTGKSIGYLAKQYKLTTGQINQIIKPC